MDILRPETAGQLAEALRAAASVGRTIRLGGASTKCAMAGPLEPADLAITTTGLNRVLKYEPGDLTISVEAGLPFAELGRVLAAHRQMVPLDPPFAASATVGGVVAANTCGPRRRMYGTARDMVIGMKFVTLEGKIVESGGMVVKNVAGLDTAKLMIGSFGTLAAIAVVNFKLVPAPAGSRTFVLRFGSPDEAIAARDRILRGVLQPCSIDLLNDAASARIGRSGFSLFVRVLGTPAVTERYARELGGAAESLQEAPEQELWSRIEEFTPEFLGENPEAAVVRVPSTLSGIRDVFEAAEGAAVVARAGTGTCCAHFSAWQSAREFAGRGWNAVVDFAPEAARRQLDLWPRPGDDLGLMRRVKDLFDPAHLLNRGRMYGRF